jgi:hypothetical protein
MGFEDETEQSFGRPCRQSTAEPSRHANSPHPSSREGHLSLLGGARVSSYRIDFMDAGGVESISLVQFNLNMNGFFYEPLAKRM